MIICKSEGCKKAAHYNVRGEKARYCGQHRTPEMVNVGVSLCKICDKNAHYNIVGQKAAYCHSHKTSEMRNVSKKPCKMCPKNAVYGYENEPREYCHLHKKSGMSNKSTPKCKKCDRYAYYNVKGQFRAYCSDHKTTEMIRMDVQYCDDTICKKTKEEQVKKWLLDGGYKFVHDKQVQNMCCYRYRPDFLFECASFYVILEVDEYAHSRYEVDCERIRMNNIALSLDLPVKFIRYNPDNKKSNKKVLFETLNKELSREYTDIEPIYLFY